MNKVIIKVPATTANIGPGFDILGLSLNIYNEFEFILSEKMEVIGFNEIYGLNDNLVFYAYKKVFERIGSQPINCKIVLTNNNIPISRGLGSSASCIVAGVLGANAILGNPFSKVELLDIMSSIEGHPDNVAPALLGGLVASYKVNDTYKTVSYPVSDKLIILAAIPDFELETSKSRSVLPKVLSYSDITYNASRLINIPYAFSRGDVEMLRELLDDKMHEPYRLPLIEDSVKIKELAHQLNNAFCLSGAGPTLLLIGKDYQLIKEISKLPLVHKWKVLALQVNLTGAIVEVF